jgi:hypothetical protein
MAQQTPAVDASDEPTESTVEAGQVWRLDMSEASAVTDAERRKDRRMFGDRFAAFSARVEEVNDDLVTLTVLSSNTHQRSPDVGATVSRIDRFDAAPEWSRRGGE